MSAAAASAMTLLLLLLAAAPAAVEPVGGGSLLPCGTTDASSLPELQHAFEFAHGVCCDHLGETCGPSALGLPTTCASATCARAVALVNASCAALLASPAFPVGIGFQPILDAANAACAQAADARVVLQSGSGALMSAAAAFAAAGGAPPPRGDEELEDGPTQWCSMPLGYERYLRGVGKSEPSQRDHAPR
jgi:hypothetical protein